MATILSAYNKDASLNIDPSDLIIIIIIHSFFFLMFYLFNRFLNVEIDEEFLYIRGIFKKDQTPFSNMECVTSGFGIISVYFKNKTRFGKKICFCPYLFLPLFFHPIADELKNKIIKDEETTEAIKKSIAYQILTRH